ncbi:PREDICTED: uncharacterized protein LOC105579285 [Cercocebus atys]|uniref:uncharacterized protein LOC105579285 n=1 Tax=Cercocebus atys TaxID=9531 RepID=UPI0005F3D0D3|nr:PREDICTED: uncharacterized protein LOC105579285 [Cercocebus atys]
MRGSGQALGRFAISILSGDCSVWRGRGRGRGEGRSRGMGGPWASPRRGRLGRSLRGTVESAGEAAESTHHPGRPETPSPGAAAYDSLPGLRFTRKLLGLVRVIVQSMSSGVPSLSEIRPRFIISSLFAGFSNKRLLSNEVLGKLFVSAVKVFCCSLLWISVGCSMVLLFSPRQMPGGFSLFPPAKMSIPYRDKGLPALPGLKCRGAIIALCSLGFPVSGFSRLEEARKDSPLEPPGGAQPC